MYESKVFVTIVLVPIFADSMGARGVIYFSHCLLT